MSEVDEGLVFNQLVAIVTRYSGPGRFSADGRIYADLGINGSDFVELMDEIEARFGVDLEEVSPTTPDATARDVSVNELARIIASKA